MGPPHLTWCYASPVLTRRIPLPARNHSFSPKCSIFQYRDFFSRDPTISDVSLSVIILPSPAATCRSHEAHRKSFGIFPFLPSRDIPVPSPCPLMGLAIRRDPHNPHYTKQLLARLQEPPKLEESGISFPNSAPLARFPYFPPSWAESSPGISTLQPSHHQRSLHTFPDCFFFGRSQSPEASRGLLKLWPQERLSCGIPTEHQPGCRGKQGGVCEV